MDNPISYAVLLLLVIFAIRRLAVKAIAELEEKEARKEDGYRKELHL